MEQVRFAACEALYNIGKVSRAMMLPFFTRVFDIMCKLVADSDDLCRQGGGLIDRLFKDIITEQDVEIDLPQFVELFSLRIYVRNASVRKVRRSVEPPAALPASTTNAVLCCRPTQVTRRATSTVVC